MLILPPPHRGRCAREVAACPPWEVVDCGIQKGPNFSMFYTYILKSLKDSKHYYGFCEDIDARLKYHNAGQVKSTKSRRPFVLHYSESFASKTEAINRERYFKSIDGYNWLKQNKII